MQNIPESISPRSRIYWDYRLRNELNARLRRIADRLVGLEKDLYEQRADDGCILKASHYLWNCWGDWLLKRRLACDKRIRIFEHEIWVEEIEGGER